MRIRFDRRTRSFSDFRPETPYFNAHSLNYEGDKMFSEDDSSYEERLKEKLEKYWDTGKWDYDEDEEDSRPSFRDIPFQVASGVKDSSIRPLLWPARGMVKNLDDAAIKDPARDRELINKLIQNNRGVDTNSGGNRDVRFRTNKGVDMSVYFPQINKIRARNAIELAHELGHSDNYWNRDKQAVRKYKLDFENIGNVANESKLFPALLANSFHSGFTTERNRLGHKKTNPLVAYKGVGLSAAAQVPTLIEEGRASLKGLKLLKDAGATSDEMRQARKGLANAYGTYLLNAGINVGLNAGAHLAGVGAANLGNKRLFGRRPMKKYGEVLDLSKSWEAPSVLKAGLEGRERISKLQREGATPQEIKRAKEELWANLEMGSLVKAAKAGQGQFTKLKAAGAASLARQLRRKGMV